MNYICKILSASFVLALELMFPASLHAQPEGESILQRKMQQRYRPQDEPFSDSFSDRLFLSVRGGYNHIFADNFSSGTAGTIALDIWLNSRNGLRMEGGYSWFMENFEAARVSLTELRLSYLFNLSSYLFGYRSSRAVELRPMAGVGFAPTYFAGHPVRGALSVHAGLDLSFMMVPGIYLYASPAVVLQQDALNLARMDVWRKYLLALRGEVGLGMSLGKKNYTSRDPGQSWFVTLTSGAQLQYSDLTKESGEYFSRLGPAFSVGGGRFYPKGWAWRGLLAASSHTWDRTADRERLASSYADFRLEAMLDLISAFGGDSAFAASVFVGPEIGYMKKEDISLTIRHQYTGLSTGVQFKYRFIKHFAAFLESRVAFIPYSAVTYNRVSVNQNYYDGLVSLSLGAEYQF